MHLKKTSFIVLFSSVLFALFWLYYTDFLLFPVSGDVKAPEGKPLPDRTHTPEKIIFASCNHQNKSMKIWGFLIAEKADFMVLMGDSVYGGSLIRHAFLSRLKKAYQALAKRPEFIIARKEISMIPVWDDGDYGQRDGGKSFSAKEASKSLFLKFWSVPQKDERQKRDGLYQSWIFGSEGKRVQIIVLDTRFFKDSWTPTDHKQAGKERYIPTRTGNPSMLGAQQWHWLGKQLSKPAEIRFIVSSIQVIANGHGYESWKLFPHQQTRLYKMIDETGANGVIFVSGDRHIGALYKKTGVTSYPLYELTSSSLNFPKKTRGTETGPNQIGNVYTHENFGVAEIDWKEKIIQLKLKDIHGNTVKQIHIPFSSLSAQKT